MREMEGIEDRVRQHFNSMTKSHKKLAKYFLNNLNDIPFYSSSEIARKIGVAKTTVIRFAYAIGYDGYNEIKRELQRKIKDNLTPPQLLEQSLKDRSHFDRIEEAFDVDILNIQETKKGISKETLLEISRHIVRSRRIYVVGMRSVFSLAHLLSTFLSQILPDVILLQPGEGNFAHQIIPLDQRDFVIAISFPRYSKFPYQILQRAKERGAKTLSISDSAVSVLGEHSEYLLVAKCACPTYFNSYAAAVSVINSMVMAVTLVMGKKSLKKLMDTEEILKDWDILFSE